MFFDSYLFNLAFLIRVVILIIWELWPVFAKFAVILLDVTWIVYIYFIDHKYERDSSDFVWYNILYFRDNISNYSVKLMSPSPQSGSSFPFSCSLLKDIQWNSFNLCVHNERHLLTNFLVAPLVVSMHTTASIIIHRKHN